MNREEIIDRINGFLIEEFEVSDQDIHPEAQLKEALQLDSLDYVDLVVEVESNFGFKVKPEDFQGIHTFQDFYEYIIRKIESK